VTSAQLITSQEPNAQTYLEVLPGSGIATVAEAQFITTESGARVVNTSGEEAVVALGTGNSTLIGGAGNSAVIGGSGDDVYGFLNGHGGGQQDIYGFSGNDQLAFGGYTGNPIATEGVGSAGDLIQLSDGTIINLVGVNHTLFT
jgi:Ca2+-binding RTX toxin-like protein